MYVSSPAVPTFLAPAQPVRVPVQAPGVAYSPYASSYSPYGGSTAFTSSAPTSDPLYNMKVLATNVWNTLVNVVKSLFSSVQRALSQPHN